MANICWQNSSASSLASCLCPRQEVDESDYGKGAVLSMENKTFQDFSSRLSLMSHWHMGIYFQLQGRLQIVIF